MVVSSIVRRLLLALALCSAAVAAFSSPASARSYRHYHHYARHITHVRHVAYYGRHYVHRRSAEEMDMTGASNWDRAATALRQPRFAHVSGVECRSVRLLVSLTPLARQLRFSSFSSNSFLRTETPPGLHSR